jgi:type IV pilus assembly protein PilE
MLFYQVKSEKCAARTAILHARRAALPTDRQFHYYSMRMKGNRMKTLQRARGFNLIELMIVVVIIAILAAVAIPNYSQYVKRGHRSAAQQLIMKIASREEQYRLDARAYTAALTGAASINLSGSEESYTCTAAQCANPYYTITVALVAGPPPGYLITATATGTQASFDPVALTLDALGTKSPTEVWQK